jgi:hypothetical protein
VPAVSNARLVTAVGTVAASLALFVGLVRAGRLSAAPEIAHDSRTFSLNETARLHLTGKHGFTLNEQGTVSGTLSGAIYVHLTIVSTSRVAAEVNIYPRGGSISGYATAGYQHGSEMGSFSGSMSIVRGTGAYRRARGSGLAFDGTILRSNYAIAVQVSGTVSD